jgi:protein phosphatase
MAPTGTSQEPGLLEHPAEAFSYYRGEGVDEIICEEKHMGSRAIVIVCRDETVAPRRFGIEGDGICYTRTGRPFFEDTAIQAGLLDRVRSALGTSGLWEDLETDWLALDCELLPWSAKALELLRSQYASTGASSRVALTASVRALEAAVDRGLDLGDMLLRHRDRLDMAERFVEAYRRYCWEVESLDDLRLAPFQILAGEGRVHADRNHSWHMETIERAVRASDDLLHPTQLLVLNVTDPVDLEAGTRWWESITSAGGEGMVVKPAAGIARGRRGTVQPGVKVRGREYLRLIYGPEYTASEHLERLRERSLTRKRSLAVREFALGIEAMERFVRKEPLYRVHECVFGVLALESESVDPRL